ncbi:hypothetical protein H6P81_005476 [Aristolochia fimbriata]|uniref:START domain-containing protein n=1 Tax=Aristolochia fimbriata TaxID=158543 RepID=A0AAV7EUP6_ARIFI|nr:hypothetical protein H6P81_005476 [Aristolochia fimbriata]
MDEIYGDFLKFFEKPALVDTFVDILLCAVPIWLAVMIGLVIGWSWRPRWTGLVYLGFRSRFRFLWTAPPGFGARRLWLAFTALSAFSVCRKLWSNLKEKEEPGSKKSAVTGATAAGGLGEEVCKGDSAISDASEVEQDTLTHTDLEHLLHLLEGKIGESSWQHMMDRSTSNMAYQAWRYEPPVGPVIYRSRTVFEDATPELVRDFFWDDDFRQKWDAMLAYFKTLEEHPLTGEMTVHWIKKFPFFCSDREYIFGRRIWESSKTYYCVTKGIPYAGVPKRDKPRRVELYFSSWRIRAVESRKGDGQISACEVTLFHYEDMGIPKDVAKVGLRHGMWGTVKKLHSGFRAYQLARKGDAALSRCALMARIATKISVGDPNHPLDRASLGEDKTEAFDFPKIDQGARLKWLLIGGAVAVVCGLNSGAIGKALLFGAARRLARN